MKPQNWITVPQIIGKKDNVEITIVNISLRTTDGSTKHYPDSEFGAWLIEELLDRQKILATKKGIFNKRLLCSKCNTELNKELQTPMLIEYELKYNNMDPFIVKVSIPAVECPNCKKINGIDTNGVVYQNLLDAFVNAFESENVKP